MREFDPTLTQHHTFLFLWLFLNMAISNNNLSTTIVLLLLWVTFKSVGPFFKKFRFCRSFLRIFHFRWPVNACT